MLLDNEKKVWLFGTIVTKYLNPTDCKGARVKATCKLHGELKPLVVIVPYSHDLNHEGNHQKAAQALITKYNVKTDGVKWYCGHSGVERHYTPDYCGYCTFKDRGVAK